MEQVDSHRVTLVSYEKQACPVKILRKTVVVSYSMGKKLSLSLCSDSLSK